MPRAAGMSRSGSGLPPDVQRLPVRAALVCGTSFSGTPRRAPVAPSSIRRQPSRVLTRLRGFRQARALLVAEYAGVLAAVAALEGLDGIGSAAVRLLPRSCRDNCRARPDRPGWRGAALPASPIRAAAATRPSCAFAPRVGLDGVAAARCLPLRAWLLASAVAANARALPPQLSRPTVNASRSSAVHRRHRNATRQA